MDILSARKKAAERAKTKKKAQPESKKDSPLSQEKEPSPSPEQAGKDAEAAVTTSVPESPAHPGPGPSGQPSPVPGDVAGAVPVPEIELLAFRLGTEEYALLVEQVREVIKLWEITSVPNTPDYVLGVLSLRGKVLPVIDLCKRLGLPSGARDGRARIIVVSLDDEETGLIVDRVTGVVRLLPKDVRPAPDTISQGVGEEFLRGIARKDDKLYILLDIEKAAGK
jgi:purine-binding chemotaxis protein CheW